MDLWGTADVKSTWSRPYLFGHNGILTGWVEFGSFVFYLKNCLSQPELKEIDWQKMNPFFLFAFSLFNFTLKNKLDLCIKH